MEKHLLPALLLVSVLSVTTVCGTENTKTVSCPKNQKAHNGSCYEFVTLQRSFVHAQASCERSGGHLAFIHDEETQRFLQKHLQPGNNWWLGLASASSRPSSPSSQDVLSWLDGAVVSYSNWFGRDAPGPGCGFVSKDSGFQWESTSNCSQEFFFICEFESGQSLSCMDNHATLKCGSGQVIEIDESFYGRNNVHYCIADPSLSEDSSVEDGCSWVDVVSVVAGICTGQRDCKVPADTAAFGEPCPHLGSYLSIKYHCKHATHRARRSSRLKRFVWNQGNQCRCQDINDFNIRCLSNCDSKVNIDQNIPLKTDPDVTNVEWFYIQQYSSVSVTCRNSNDRIFLSGSIGNGSYYTISSGVLQELGYSNHIYIIARGFKNENIVNSCKDFQIQDAPQPNSNSNSNSGPNSNSNSNSGPNSNSNSSSSPNSNSNSNSSPNSNSNSSPNSNSNSSPSTTTNPPFNPTQITTTTNSANSPSTTASPTPDCNISPNNGYIYTPFTVICTQTQNFCPVSCVFTVKSSKSAFVYSSTQDIMSNLFLPLGHNRLTVTIMNVATNKISVTLSANVQDMKNNSALDAQNAVSAAVSLQTNGLISIFTLAKLFETISDNINSSFSEEAKKELVESMCQALCYALSQDNVVTQQDELTIISSSVLSLVKRSDMTHNAKKGACCVLHSLSQNIFAFLEGNATLADLALPIVTSASFLLSYSADNDQEISETLISIMNELQTTLLTNKTINTEPLTVISPLIHLYVNRVTPDNLSTTQISSGENAANFSLPPSLSSLVPSSEPVDLRMINFGKNPFGWSEYNDVSGIVSSLSLTSENGTLIPVESLDEEIEILLPRLGGPAAGKTFLNLTSQSTMNINVTAPNITLVVKLEPSDNTPLMLHLGFQHYPNDTNYVAKIQFPQPGDSQEMGYTWVLYPTDVTLNVGAYYLLVRPVVSAGVTSSNALVYITSIAANCKYWNETSIRWNEDGCRVGPRTSSLVTQCLCTHLTSFGSSFFVMPNTVDVSRTAELFSSFSNNPVVVCFVGSIFLAYIIAVIWARKKDLQDKIKVRITVLEDNDPLAEYRYLVAVTTGHRHGAATTSHVTLTLIGTVWESKPHYLADPDKAVFTRGAADIFFLTTPFSLGEVQSIRLWHDNSGERPDWYVSKVMVQDLETGQIWNFLCNSWLAIDIGDCTLDKLFHVATEQELKGFHNLFFTKTVKDFCDGHIWYSVVNRPAKSNFTRVQRLSCCFSLLLCTMLTSIMFWGIPKSPSEQNMELGTITFNIQQVMIGIQSSIIMFPVNLLIVTIFRITRPRKKKEVAIVQESKSESHKQEKTLAEKWRIQTDITIEIIIKDLKGIVRALCKAVKCPVPKTAEENEATDIQTLLFVLEDIIRKENFAVSNFFAEDLEKDPFLVYRQYRQHLYKQLRNLEKELRLLGPSRFPKPDGYIQSVLQLRSVKQLLEPYLSSSPVRNEVQVAGPEEEEKKKCYQKGLPWWFVIVGWILVVATSGVSAYFTMMYGLTYGKDRSISWLISISVSFFESLFLTQPIKVLGLAIFFALVLKKVESEDEDYFHLLKDMTLTYSEDPDDIRISRRDNTCRFYQPPPPAAVEKMKENYIKNQKAIALIKEIIIYIAFLCVLLVATYGQRDPNAYYLTQHIQQRFSNGITDSMSPRDVFTWANDFLISNLYGQRPGFITDGNSLLVGSARIRQIRVHRDSCRISKTMQSAVHDCNAPYSWDIEDMGPYGPGWNRSRDVNMTKSLQTPWQYQTESKLRGHPVWGTVAFYRGGGFVLDLGIDPEKASSMLQYLFNNTWLDIYTRAVFVEFTVYNANVNLFCIVTLMLETTALGAFQYSAELHNLRLYQTTDGINIVAAEVIYFLFILYYMYIQIKKIKQQKLQYFGNKHNLLELAIILLSLAAVGAIVNRTIQGNQDLKYFQEHPNQFPSFYKTASADATLGYILAFLILLGTVKMWHLMRLNSKLNLITCTLQRAWNDISSFIVVLVIMILAYSLVSNLLFGWILYTYKTLQDSILAIIALQLGIFNYEEILDLNPVLGAFLILSCVMFLTFVVLNLFIAVILEAFSHEQKHYKPSEEEEVVDLMMTKICKMFGIPVKKK